MKASQEEDEGHLKPLRDKEKMIHWYDVINFFKLNSFAVAALQLVVLRLVFFKKAVGTAPSDPFYHKQNVISCRINIFPARALVANH